MSPSAPTPAELLSLRDFEERVARSLRPLRTHSGASPRLLVAVSGGADSVALLRALKSLSDRGMCTLHAVHCNFHLRSSESDRDAESVERLCASLGVGLTVADIDIPAWRRAHRGVSVEMACRDSRYALFRRMMREGGYDRIAVAHNSDDQAETLLLNLLRGAGSQGLKGMRRDTGEILRPLLGIGRSEILAYLNALGQPYVTDSSNLRSDYRRNFLRLEVLPLLETRWPAARAMLARSASLLEEENALLTDALERLSPPGRRELAYAVVEGCPAPVTLLRHFISPFGGTRLQAEEMARSCGRPGGEWRLGGSEGEWCVHAGHSGWRIAPATDATVEGDKEMDGEDLGGWVCEEVEMTPEEWGAMRSRRDARVLYLPRPLEEYRVRRVQPGDRIRPLGMKGSRKVSDVLKDAGVPRERRGLVRVVEDPADGEILWVEGLCRSRKGLLSPEARRAWRVTF